MRKKIGIPKILWYYETYPFWNIFFENLGLEPITSSDTNKKIIRDSITYSTPEMCLPSKLAFGHIIDIKDKVDYIFLPYISSLFKNSYNCMNFSGLPDIIRHSNLKTPCNISCFVDCNIEQFFVSVFKLGLSFTKNPFKIFFAYLNAINGWKEYKNKNYKQIELLKDVSNIKVGILSYPYILNDSLLGKVILRNLKKMKVIFVHNGMIKDKDLENISIPPKIMCETERKMLKCFYLFLQKGVDSIINITSFYCGSYAVISEIFHNETNKRNIPFFQLIIDEHFQDASMVTGIETFIELIKRKNKQ